MHPDFEPWLRSLGYAETTIRNTLREVRLAVELLQARALVERVERPVLRRYAVFCEEHGHRLPRGYGELLERRAAPGGLRGGRRGPRRRREARSFDDGDWRKITAAIVADPAEEARVLEVLAATALRIGDVLRLERRAFEQGLRDGLIVGTQKGGARWQRRPTPAWQRLWAAWRADPEARSAPNVAGWICPSNPSPEGDGCAYKRIDRTLKRIATPLEIAGPVHLHRFRRTLAVQTLRETRDPWAASKLLNHSSTQSLQSYVDEARVDDVAELEDALQKKFR